MKPVPCEKDQKHFIQASNCHVMWTQINRHSAFISKWPVPLEIYQCLRYVLDLAL